MTWKTTAGASGLMLVATWLASHSPVGGPRQPPSAAPSAAHTESASAEIQREADRLHDRLQQAAAYREPSRNPFRFGAPRPPARPAPAEPAITIEEMPAAPAPATPRLTLSGIAEDVAGEQVVRTAIISSPETLHLVKVGDVVGEMYRVAVITADGVELVRLDDQSVVRLSLRP